VLSSDTELQRRENKTADAPIDGKYLAAGLSATRTLS
jgi:hypothetical protein